MNFRAQVVVTLVRVVTVEINPRDCIDAPKILTDNETLEVIAQKAREKFDAEMANLKYDSIFVSNITRMPDGEL